MSQDLIARSTVEINASADAVWEALVSPEAIKVYMFGADVVSEWHEGSPIVWKGEWQGKPYKDRGVITRFSPGRRLQYTHFSPLRGLPDTPENYHTVTIELDDNGHRTSITLSQDNNHTEAARDHSAENWEKMLTGLKEYVEGTRA